MKLLDCYFIRRLITIGVFAVLVFTVSWLAPEILFKAIQGVARHQLTLQQGMLYLFYQIPGVLIYCLPISTLFASVFLFRQLSLDSELTAILASGISFRRLLLPAALFGMGMGLCFFLTQEILVPWASGKLRELNRTAHLDSRWDINHQVTFVEKAQNGAMDKFLVISPEAVEDQNQFIFLFYKNRDGQSGISRMVTATRGTWNDALQAWELRDGIDYLLNEQGIYQQVAPFQYQVIPTSPVAHALLSFPTGNPAAFRVKQLEKYVRLLHKGQQTEDARFYEVRLFQRYFFPWVPVLFAVLGTAIGVERSRGRRNLGLTYAAALLLFYNSLVPVFTTLGTIGLLATFVGALLPLVMATFGGWAIIQLRKSEG